MPIGRMVLVNSRGAILALWRLSRNVVFRASTWVSKVATIMCQHVNNIGYRKPVSLISHLLKRMVAFEKMIQRAAQENPLRFMLTIVGGISNTLILSEDL